MLNSSRLFGLIKYTAIFLLLLLLAGPYLRAQSERVREQYLHVERPPTPEDEKQLFISRFLAGDVGGPIKGTEIAAMCAKQSWLPDDKAVIVSCDPVAGGIGHVKNGQLNCIRFAIEIGAQLVLPRMHTRSPADITKLHGGQQSKGVDMEYMFSTSHLVNTLSTHCPQLQVHASLDALYDKPSLLKPLTVSLPQLALDAPKPIPAVVLDGVETSIVADPGVFRPQLLALMEDKLPTAPARRYPVRVHVLSDPQFVWPAAADGPGFRHDFGRLLRARDDARALAASILWTLTTRHNISLTSSSSTAPHTPADADGPGGFLGVHLRTEKDAIASGAFPGYADQTPYFLRHLQSLPPLPSSSSSSSPGAHHPHHDGNNNNNGGNNIKRIVYLATGLTASDPDVRSFRAEAAEHGAVVLLKRDLLSDDEAAALAHMTWDQRALVDYEVLLRAGRVLGPAESSFGWSVALRRAEAYGGGIGDTGEGGGGGAGKNGFVAKPGGDQFAAKAKADPESLRMWSDRWSRLYGKADRAVSIYLGTWP